MKTMDRPTGPLRDDLIVLSRAIHGAPELAYQERQAVGNIAALLKRHGHDVELRLGGLETAFRTQEVPQLLARLGLPVSETLPISERIFSGRQYLLGGPVVDDVPLPAGGSAPTAGVTRTVAGIWWEDAQTPIAAYLLAYWKDGLGERWEPMRDLWSRYA